MRTLLVISASTLGILVLAAVAIAILVHFANKPNRRIAKFGQNTQFHGSLRGGSVSGATYFRFQVGEEHTPLPESPVHLRIAGKEFMISMISPDDVQQMGGNVVVPYSDPENVRRHIRWGEHSEAGGLSFYFRDSRLAMFEASWFLPEPSPFSVRFQDGPWLSFPCTDEQILEAVGTPDAVVDGVAK